MRTSGEWRSLDSSTEAKHREGVIDGLDGTFVREVRGKGVYNVGRVYLYLRTAHVVGRHRIEIFRAFMLSLDLGTVHDF
jgi:hypothetical protein